VISALATATGIQTPTPTYSSTTGSSGSPSLASWAIAIISIIGGIILIAAFYRIYRSINKHVTSNSAHPPPPPPTVNMAPPSHVYYQPHYTNSVPPPQPPPVVYTGVQVSNGEIRPHSFTSGEDDERQTYVPPRNVPSILSWRERVSPTEDLNEHSLSEAPPSYELSEYGRGRSIAH
jgi:hypothetical protein